MNMNLNAREMHNELSMTRNCIKYLMLYNKILSEIAALAEKFNILKQISPPFCPLYLIPS